MLQVKDCCDAYLEAFDDERAGLFLIRINVKFFKAENVVKSISFGFTFII